MTSSRIVVCNDCGDTELLSIADEVQLAKQASYEGITPLDMLAHHLCLSCASQTSVTLTDKGLTLTSKGARSCLSSSTNNHKNA